MFRSSLLTAITLLTTCLSIELSAQCINSYPYTQDFEKMVKLQSTSSCDVSVTGDTIGGWTQDQSDGGEWRSDSAGTPSIATGPGATLTTSGMGAGKDYSPGTTRGIYLYTEATSATLCPNVAINLLSPCFDFSAKSTYYQLKFAYHMFGATMGSLHIDVYDGSKWTNDVWKVAGDQGTAWKLATVHLANFNGSSVQIRIRAVMGSNFYSDCAIDAIVVESYNAPDYDALIYDLSYTPSEYFFVPLKHASPFTFSGKIKNEGVKAITGAALSYKTSTASDTSTIGNIASFAIDSTTFSKTYKPTVLADSAILIKASLNEKDGDTSNNTGILTTHISKTQYSRDRGTYSGGIGAGTNAQVGTMYELLVKDTISSVSFMLVSPTVGDSMKVHLYTFASNYPGTLIASSNSIIATAGNQWRTVKFNCEQILNAGTYFIAVEQLNVTNMSLGTNQNCFKTLTSFYKTTANWIALENNAVPFFVCPLIRLNLDGVEYPMVTITSKDTLCQGEVALLKGAGATTYQWSPTGIVYDPNQANTNMASDTSFMLRLTGTNTCGYKTTVEKPIVVKRNPSAVVNKDTTICKKQSVILKVKTNNKFSWIGGPSNTNYTVTPGSSVTYRVNVDSTNGCTKQYAVKVDVSVPIPVTSNDTTVCQAQDVTMKVSGGAMYQWVGGPNTQTYKVKAGQTKHYVVNVTDAFGCSEKDSVGITVLPGPALKTSNDTAVCFGQSITMKASGSVSYKWTDGPATANFNTIPVFNKTYYVLGTAGNGCSLVDSVVVGVANIPQVSVQKDTTICEGKSVVVTANTADQVTFKWTNGEETKSITAMPTKATKYKVVVRNTIGCSAEDSLTISVNPLPILKISHTLTVRDVTFTNNSVNGTSYEWDFGDGETSTNKNEFHKYTADGDYMVKYKVTNNCGSKDTSFTITIKTVGLSDLTFGDLLLKPNPTTGTIYLSFENNELGNVQMQLFDLSGKLVQVWNVAKTSVDFKTQLSLGDLSEGMYWLKVSTENGEVTKRLLMQR